jgi:hypothetical protein
LDWPTRPPTRLRASRMVTRWPWESRTSAQRKPENPAPMMPMCNFLVLARVAARNIFSWERDVFLSSKEFRPPGTGMLLPHIVRSIFYSLFNLFYGNELRMISFVSSHFLCRAEAGEIRAENVMGRKRKRMGLRLLHLFACSLKTKCL